MQVRRMLVLIAALAAFAPQAMAEVKTREVDYTQGDVPLQGFVAWDDAIAGKRPGVLVVHEWWGHNEHARNQAKRLAEAGYVGFALDLYGKGKLATHPADAQAFMTEAMKDLSVLVARFDAALALLKQEPTVDSSRIGAIGYCFGGAVVLNRVRAGYDFDAVTSFHGALGTETPAEKGKVKARILVCTGAADAMVPASQVEAFRKEMKAAGAKFEIVTYPGAKHSFTNPDAGKAGMENLLYNEAADRKSWAKMLALFKKAL